MSLEFERKYLVIGDGWREEVEKTMAIGQGYIANNEQASVRVRLAEGEGTLTIKSQDLDGIARIEVEASIDPDDARLLLERLTSGAIVKTRHLLRRRPYIWTVDEFGASNTGLILLEVEAPNEFVLNDTPNWIGHEVTFDPRFKNSFLSEHPYASWGGVGSGEDAL